MRTASQRLMYVAFIFVLMVGVQQGCLAVDTDEHIAAFTSNSIGPFLAAGELSLWAGNLNDKQESIQGAKALMATGLVTQILKMTVREPRPHSDSRTSFPSGHTSAAFAMATVIGDYKPQYKVLVYGTAAAIGWSRVEVGAHYWQDVVAGAALGHFIAKHFTNEHIVPTAGGLGLQWKW